jgi:hypothetical protein
VIYPRWIYNSILRFSYSLQTVVQIGRKFLQSQLYSNMIFQKMGSSIMGNTLIGYKYCNIETVSMIKYEIQNILLSLIHWSHLWTTLIGQEMWTLYSSRYQLSQYNSKQYLNILSRILFPMVYYSPIHKYIDLWSAIYCIKNSVQLSYL